MPAKSDVIVLIGPMGVGKTTVGKKLSKVIKLPFCDTDSLITSEHGTISDYFASHGESAFREVEHLALKQSINTPGVVATGGGAILLEKSRDLLKTATVIYLATNGKYIGSRLRNNPRPLLTRGMEDWQRIYESRKPIYEATADFIVDVSGKPLAEIITEIREKLNI